MSMHPTRSGASELRSRADTFNIQTLRVNRPCHAPHPFACIPPSPQAEEQQLKDFGGDYEYYLSKNDSEAQKMAVKEARAKAIVQSQTKAKSKMTKAEKEKLKKEKAKTFNDAAAGKSKRR